MPSLVLLEGPFFSRARLPRQAQASFPCAPPSRPTEGRGCDAHKASGTPDGLRSYRPGDGAPAHRRGHARGAGVGRRRRGCHSQRWSPPLAAPGGSGSSLPSCLSPTMVLESVVADLLNRFLGDYVENLNKSQLKLGIWGGKREGRGRRAAGAEGPAEGCSVRDPARALLPPPPETPPFRCGRCSTREPLPPADSWGPSPDPGWGDAAGSRRRCQSSHLSSPPRPSPGPAVPALPLLSLPCPSLWSSRCTQRGPFGPTA